MKSSRASVSTLPIGPVFLAEGISSGWNSLLACSEDTSDTLTKTARPSPLRTRKSGPGSSHMAKRCQTINSASGKLFKTRIILLTSGDTARGGVFGRKTAISSGLAFQDCVVAALHQVFEQGDHLLERRLLRLHIEQMHTAHNDQLLSRSRHGDIQAFRLEQEVP